jgi:hypothetical protein
MALKPDRYEHRTDISYFMTDVAERGIIVVHDTAGSGAAMDSSKAKVKIPATVSGSLPVGLLLNDVVNLDLTRQHINFHQDEMQSSGKVTLLREGFVVTNKVSGTPTVGAPAYYNLAGEVTTTQTTAGSYSQPSIGRFLSVKDTDGYIKIDVHIV